jgi:hypothetical protein
MPAIGEEWDDRQMAALTTHLRQRFGAEENDGS